MSTFISKAEKLLLDAAEHQAFASQTGNYWQFQISCDWSFVLDLIKPKLAAFGLAIFPDPEGFILFREQEGSSRPEHVLLRIRPMTIDLCSPQHRSLLPTFSSERHSVTSLQEALTEFAKSSSWPVVRRGQFGINWVKDESTSQPRLDTERVDRQWDDDAGSRDVHQPFLDDTVQNFHKQLHPDKQKRCI